jgi:hypothetical protein
MNAAHRLVGVQELLNPCAQLSVVTSGLVQESGPLVGRTLQGSEEEQSGLVFDHAHGILTGISPLLINATQPGEFSHEEEGFSGRYWSFNSSLHNHARA